MMFAFFVVNAFLALAVAIPTTNHVIHERRDIPASSWEKRAAMPSTMQLPMRIGLKQSNLDKAHDLLMDISSPKSPNYGKHLTAEEVTNLVAPASETFDTVRLWLEESGIDGGRISTSTNKVWLQFDAAVEEAEQLLKTKFHLFANTETGDMNVACDEYSVPGHITNHIDYVTPGIRLLSTGGRSTTRKRDFGAAPTWKPLPKELEPTASNVDDVTNCDTLITPACIRALYSIPIGTTAAAGNALGIYEYGDTYAQGDLDLFFTNNFPQIPNGTAPNLRSVDGAQAPAQLDSAGSESNLDFQLAFPIVYPQGTELFQVDDAPLTRGSPLVGLFNNLLDAIDGSYCTYSYMGETGNDPGYDNSYPDNLPGGYTGQLMCGVYQPTNVISVSYGLEEATLSAAYQQRQCQEWMKLGLQGVSVVFASGDSGVGGRRGCLGANRLVFNPGCPYITTVGSTYLPKGSNVLTDDEVSTTTFASGGGFSNIYDTPDYQKAAVDAYFANADPIVKAYKSYSIKSGDPVGANGGLFNRDGRGYPDVAAVGDNIVEYLGGRAVINGGTSASAPVFASILTRINEERIAAGKGTVGFVNPVLYAYPEMFYDITNGTNPACRTNGFYAGKGWDPVSGMGTPFYPNMADVFMGLQ
ncbi:Tripeptidyl-peptidase sed1 [Lachnellula suecica]|uniref:Tripeptidyl-peptidase sed1 n=1 Tax=Lachnellula suecica TaxID=602035 RepID=A0A8T9C3N4_9HELO|nr:Tripeptidyl-peptidase sed1 [Lachnellula suecica]